MILIINNVNFAVRFKSYLSKSVFPAWYTMRLLSNLKKERNTNTASYVSKLVDQLSCSVGTAYLLLNRNKKILTLDMNNVHKVASFCRNNFKLSEVVELPAVMSVSPYLLSDRTSTLRELGCHTITTGNVLLFKQFMQGTPSRLHQSGFLTFPESFFSHIMSHLNCPDDLKLLMTSRFLDLYSSNFKFSKIKATVNAMYLAWKLECSEEKAMDALHQHSSLRTKSLVNLERVCDVLLKKFEFPLSKIHNSSSLLTLDCDNLEELMLKVPKICGLSIQHIVKKHPSILRRSANSLHDTVSVLESHGVTDIQLLSCLKILNFSASTILSRLDILADVENYHILKKSERFLWLIFYFSNENKCTKVMNHLKVPCSSNLLATDKTYFQQKSHSSHGRSSLRDICFYLAILFGNTVEEIKRELKKYPHVYLSSGQNAQKIIEYLTAEEITKEQLWNGLGIVLYDADVVIEYFTNFPNREDLYPSFSEWIEHPNLIQLLIYTIEKDQKFTGNGVYLRSTKEQTELDENEELLVEEGVISVFHAGSCDYGYNVNDL